MSKLLAILVLFLYAGDSAVAEAAPWNAPVLIDDNRATIQFSASIGGQIVKGRARKVSGRVWVDNANDPLSVRSDITIPISEVSIANESLLQKVQALLLLAGIDTIRLKIQRIRGSCRPEQVPCHGMMDASVIVRQSEQAVTFPYAVARRGQSYVVSGSTSVTVGNAVPPILSQLAQRVSVSYQLIL